MSSYAQILTTAHKLIYTATYKLAQSYMFICLEKSQVIAKEGCVAENLPRKHRHGSCRLDVPPYGRLVTRLRTWLSHR
jgi:hypothetical protein